MYKYLFFEAGLCITSKLRQYVSYNHIYVFIYIYLSLVCKWYILTTKGDSMLPATFYRNQTTLMRLGWCWWCWWYEISRWISRWFHVIPRIICLKLNPETWGNVFHGEFRYFWQRACIFETDFWSIFFWQRVALLLKCKQKRHRLHAYKDHHLHFSQTPGSV